MYPSVLWDRSCVYEPGSKENYTVLDPFMGSGTTGVACINTNRDFIGVELDEKYYKIAEERINSATK